jgi:hypothetical protein
VSKEKFYKQVAYANEGRQSHNHGNWGLKRPREATQQVVATLATIIVPLANMMLYKTCTPNEREGCSKYSSHETKME